MSRMEFWISGFVREGSLLGFQTRFIEEKSFTIAMIMTAELNNRIRCLRLLCRVVLVLVLVLVAADRC